MIENKYIIVDLNDEHLTHILECVVEDIDSARPSVDKTKIVVKLPLDCNEIPECCVHLQVYSHEEILPIMNSLEWQLPMNYYNG